MEDIEFERDGQKKVTQRRFAEALIEEGWRIVGAEPEQPKKRRGRPPKKVLSNDDS